MEETVRETVLVLYVPGLHAGYIRFFGKYPQATLYLLGPEILVQFASIKYEIRAIEPAVMQHILMCSGSLAKVIIAEEQDLVELGKRNETTIVLSTEYISNQLQLRYFANSRIIQEDIFLRFDEKSVRETYGEARYDCSITNEKFYRQVLLKVHQASTRSSDWFRRVGAALILNDPLRVSEIAHNKRMPTPQSPWLVGDPRMYLPYGSSTKLRTTLHAEEVLIAHAARDGVATEGASIVTSDYPCPDCANLIIEAEIKRIYFHHGYSDATAMRTHETFQTHNVEVWKIE